MRQCMADNLKLNRCPDFKGIETIPFGHLVNVCSVEPMP